MEEQSYTSTHPLGHSEPVTGSLYLYLKKEIIQSDDFLLVISESFCD